MTKPRKLAEIWEVDEGYHLRVEVGAFQRGLTSDSAKAEEYAAFEVIEVLREILRKHDANVLEYRSDETLPPSGA